MTIGDTADALLGDAPAASSLGTSADRRELAVIAVERTRMPMIVTDPRQDGHPIVLANQAFLDLTGHDADWVVGRNPGFMQGPETDQDAIARIRAAIRDEQDINIELINYRKDGSSFWNQLYVSPVHDQAGNLLYFFGSALDITTRREAQEMEATQLRLLLEVDHRANNVLAIVQGIVRLTPADDPRGYAKSVQGRVDMLARGARPTGKEQLARPFARDDHRRADQPVGTPVRHRCRPGSHARSGEGPIFRAAPPRARQQRASAWIAQRRRIRRHRVAELGRRCDGRSALVRERQALPICRSLNRPGSHVDIANGETPACGRRQF